jgi:glycosyltransferase involved in cell wall biosynthesis
MGQCDHDLRFGRLCDGLNGESEESSRIEGEKVHLDNISGHPTVKLLSPGISNNVMSSASHIAQTDVVPDKGLPFPESRCRGVVASVWSGPSLGGSETLMAQELALEEDGQLRPGLQELMRRELTVIIPVFRCARYLPVAIASVLHTPVRRILITDDYSGDETTAVAHEWVRRVPERVSLIEARERRGPGANVNRAVQRVDTSLFAKVDGDDVLLPGFLESVFPVIRSMPTLGMISGHEKRITGDQWLNFEPDGYRTNNTVHPIIMSGIEALRFIIEWKPNPCSSGAIYRTEAFRSVGGFDEGMSWGEDWEIWLRLAKRQWSLAYYDAPSALYRIHDNSVTAAEIRRNRMCYAYDEIFRRAASLCQDPSLRPVLRRAFFRTARTYFGASKRATFAYGSVSESLRCVAGGLGAIWKALTLS